MSSKDTGATHASHANEGARDRPACRTACATRRDFLQTASCVGVAAALLGLPRDAAALPIAFTEGAPSGGERQYPIPPGDSVPIVRK